MGNRICRKCGESVQLLYIPVMGYVYFCYKCKEYKKDRETKAVKTEGKEV